MPSESSTDTKMPGVRCPKCSTAEKDVWVIPGRSCPYCSTVINVFPNLTVSAFGMIAIGPRMRGRGSASALGK
ncbi:uncharacterized protein BKA55DRAFT_742200 [Fusarium redolens]|uniref:Uncharacterized protein n=1 Tax=Fusarium redolens TaxID=48865 RepID=A0A9P9G9X7_FUSRE|nr:uncharacterized protein BKA55DRAFT_742200 [Fusarium redolens]KAH7234692.1 hypothetical protein BKA55DRAFT_742200 [Fusarium redolens]